MIGAQRVDFIAVPTKDRAQAVKFYEETLGLPKNPNSTDTKDPDGNGIVLHHRYAPYRDGRSPDEQN